ncbi:hypothetical protein A3F00_01315 [Candidatus Daviesbacteria bacterium RIFCSPHIGHO2_12_FULL_37_11]|uniref:ROK family protein n=1 Tax=Candidatus Daviesbacteria bacterium RIFCSPHIGHO2_12_FULL_37_11 TaxID=1797777 RepID=A0A1F5KD62_9BACT|nr:MAG: hypothetical protein A3F00_01315 [Candidatus Daviesbacteria bacterium RIFCSPHIGHO2_12_FULL_37_11]OGE44821.1 MAG: hypothetical protein A3B39_00190 [Candidatus Daviesbacteria bacterium RIFCSPLOWO2_01_FULL_37_10]
MYLLFDIGGTNIRLAVSPDGKEIGEVVTIPTPQDFEDGIKEIADAAKTLNGSDEFKAAGGGIREVLDKNKSMLINDPKHSKIPHWMGKPTREKLQETLSCPVYLENDSALVALGEAIHGAGTGYKIVAYITVSTGVGGARIVNCRIDQNCLGFEPGQQIIDFKDITYLEDEISGESFKKKFGRDSYTITDETIWERSAKILAVGLNNVLVFWSPDILILGGGVMDSIPIERVKMHLKEIVRKFPDLPPVVRSKLGEKGGLYGALEYLKQVHS